MCPDPDNGTSVPLSNDTPYRLPVTICWHCDRALDGASGVEDAEAKPEPGFVSLCMYCGAIAFFSDDLRLRKPTKEELDKLFDDREFRMQFVQFHWAREYVMLKSNLMRDHTDPDR